MAIKTLDFSKYDDVVFISDVHFGMNTNTQEWVDNTVNYFENFFFPLIRQEKVSGLNPIVLCAGDFFQNRQSLNLNVMNSAMDVMEKLRNICPVILLAGNHDAYTKSDTSITSLRIFEKCENVTIIQENTGLTVGNKTFMLIPWISDITKTNKVITKLKDKYDYFILHTEISGFKYDNGRQIVNGANLSVLDGGCRVISGHIHKRQSNEKAMYLGAPYQWRRDDIGNERGIYCLRLNKDVPEWVYTNNDYSPKFVFVKYSDYGNDMEKWKEVVKNNYCWIELTEEQHKDKKFYNKFLESLLEFEPRKIEYTQEKKEKVQTESKYTEDTTMEEIFSDRVAEKNLTDEQRSELNRMNDEYIKKASEELAE